jgi:hypothetical protein
MVERKRASSEKTVSTSRAAAAKKQKPAETEAKTSGKNPLPKTKAMGMFLQDPSLETFNSDYLFPLDQDFLLGTGSSRFAIQDVTAEGAPIFPTPDWSKKPDLSFAYFQKNGLIDNHEFHQVNTFAVLSRTLDLVEEEIGHAIAWKDGAPLIVRPHAFEGMNAYYDPQNPSLNFGYFTSPFRRTPVWVCLSHDVIAHELGHAILDTCRPYYLYSTDIDTSALHESFADILAMFSALQYDSIVQHLYKETGGDMRHPSLVSRLAEEFGIGIAGTAIPFLRSALEGSKYSPEEPKEPHQRSTVWTAAIYEVMQKLVESNKPKGFEDNSEGFVEFAIALSKATRWVKGMLIRALHYTPTTGLSMPMLARLIYAADAQVYPNDAKFRDIAKEVFQSRGLWNENIDLTPPAKIGETFQALVGADAKALMRAVVQHADALRIPPSVIRIIKPRLVSTTRRIDKVKEGKSEKVQEVTEHYLEYTYEYSQMVSDFFGGMSNFAVYGGGTLVMDENWQPILLATSPEKLKEDPEGQEGATKAWQRARAKFDRIHGANIQQTLAAKDEKRSLKDRPVVPGCPFIIQHLETGGYRLARRCCQLQEHVTGISVSRNGLASS